MLIAILWVVLLAWSSTVQFSVAEPDPTDSPALSATPTSQNLPQYRNITGNIVFNDIYIEQYFENQRNVSSEIELRLAGIFEVDLKAVTISRIEHEYGCIRGLIFDCFDDIDCEVGAFTDCEVIEEDQGGSRMLSDVTFPYPDGCMGPLTVTFFSELDATEHPSAHHADQLLYAFEPNGEIDPDLLTDIPTYAEDGIMGNLRPLLLLDPEDSFVYSLDNDSVLTDGMHYPLRDGGLISPPPILPEDPSSMKKKGIDFSGKGPLYGIVAVAIVMILGLLVSLKIATSTRRPIVDAPWSLDGYTLNGNGGLPEHPVKEGSVVPGMSSPPGTFPTLNSLSASALGTAHLNSKSSASTTVTVLDNPIRLADAAASATAFLPNPLVSNPMTSNASSTTASTPSPGHTPGTTPPGALVTGDAGVPPPPPLTLVPPPPLPPGVHATPGTVTPPSPLALPGSATSSMTVPASPSSASANVEANARPQSKRFLAKFLNSGAQNTPVLSSSPSPALRPSVNLSHANSFNTYRARNSVNFRNTELGIINNPLNVSSHHRAAAKPSQNLHSSAVAEKSTPLSAV